MSIQRVAVSSASVELLLLLGVFLPVFRKRVLGHLHFSAHSFFQGVLDGHSHDGSSNWHCRFQELWFSGVIENVHVKFFGFGSGRHMFGEVAGFQASCLQVFVVCEDQGVEMGGAVCVFSQIHSCGFASWQAIGFDGIQIVAPIILIVQFGWGKIRMRVIQACSSNFKGQLNHFTWLWN